MGETVQLVATVTDGQGRPLADPPRPAFASSAPEIATVGASGLVTAVAEGGATVTATVTANGLTRSATATITVRAAPRTPAGNVVATSGTSFVPATVTISAGDSVVWQFSGATHNVTFTGAAPPGGDIADQPPGRIVARVFPTAGTYRYDCTRHSGMTGSVVVTSSAPVTYTSLDLTPTAPAVPVGGTVQLTATPRDQHGNAMAGMPDPTYSSSAPSLATVSATGLVTGVAAGTATISATLSAGGVTHSATSTVAVTAPQPGSVTVTTPNNSFSPSSVTIAPGGTVTWQFSGGTHNVTFSGAAPPGGNIPDTQSGNAATRTFPTAGSYDYQCTRHNGMTGQVVVQSGNPGNYSGIRITPSSATIGVGGTVQLSAVPVDDNGAPIPGLPAPALTSSAPAVASVDPTGLVTGLSLGSATITASLDFNGQTHTATAEITVSAGGAGLTITTPNNTFSPDYLAVVPGQTVTWQFSGATHNVTFEDLAPPGGNIPDTAPGGVVSRTFQAVGDYDYVCTLHKGMKGRIRVR